MSFVYLCYLNRVIKICLAFIQNFIHWQFVFKAFQWARVIILCGFPSTNSQ